eukprot:IDg10394t1
MSELTNRLITLLLLVVVFPFATATAITGAAGGVVQIQLGSGPVPHPAWKAGRCWKWDATAAPAMIEGKLMASLCRSVSVRLAGYYNIIADTSMPADPSKPLAMIRLFNGKTLLEWRSYYHNHEMTTLTPVRHNLMPGIDYKVCITGIDQNFDLCRLELYSCHTGIDCRRELHNHGILSLSRRNR